VKSSELSYFPYRTSSHVARYVGAYNLELFRGKSAEERDVLKRMVPYTSCELYATDFC
jgi:hypothetical protein